MTDDTQAAGAPPARDLEEAPLLLRKASKVLIAGAILPWITILATDGHVPWAYWAGAVLLTCLAGWVLVEGAKARVGLPANGAVSGVAKAHPMGTAGLCLLLFIGACVVAWIGKGWVDGNGKHIAFFVEGGSDGYGFKALLELATLLLGLATFAHILSYEYGGKFNPIFPLMFLGPAVAGSLNLIGAFRTMSSNSMAAMISLVGSIMVAAGGCMAIYTMYVSMKQAKIEGDLKRAAQREKRKSDRSSSRTRRS